MNIDSKSAEKMVRDWIRFRKWEWSLRLILATATMLGLLVFLVKLAEVKWY